VELSRGIAVQ